LPQKARFRETKNDVFGEKHFSGPFFGGHLSPYRLYHNKLQRSEKPAKTGVRHLILGNSRFPETKSTREISDDRGETPMDIG
jgi:hypothetical protein